MLNLGSCDYKFTTDNAANDNTLLKVFKQSCIKNHIEFYHKQNHVWCVAYIMNLAVQEILKYLKRNYVKKI